MSITVISMSGGNLRADGVRIDRASVLGNPFIIGRDGDRDAVLAKYRVWLDAKIDAGDPDVCRCLNRLYRMWQSQGTLVLKCWCAPKPCHGHIIKAVLIDAAKRMRR